MDASYADYDSAPAVEAPSPDHPAGFHGSGEHERRFHRSCTVIENNCIATPGFLPSVIRQHGRFGTLASPERFITIVSRSTKPCLTYRPFASSSRRLPSATTANPPSSSTTRRHAGARVGRARHDRVHDAAQCQHPRRLCHQPPQRRDHRLRAAQAAVDCSAQRRRRSSSATNVTTLTFMLGRSLAAEFGP